MIWMEKLLIWERCRRKGRKGIDDVVFFCVVLVYSIAYIVVI